VLLGAGTIVIEGLDLRNVEPGVYDMYCLPLRIVGSDGAPARVVLRKS
jgi:arylformamidase